MAQDEPEPGPAKKSPQRLVVITCRRIITEAEDVRIGRPTRPNLVPAPFQAGAVQVSDRQSGAASGSRARMAERLGRIGACSPRGDAVATGPDSRAG